MSTISELEKILQEVINKYPYRTIDEKIKFISILINNLSSINAHQLIKEEVIVKALEDIKAPKNLFNKISYYHSELKRLTVQNIVSEIIDSYAIKYFYSNYQQFDTDFGYFKNISEINLHQIIKAHSTTILNTYEITEIAKHIKIDSIVSDDEINNHQQNNVIHCKNSMVNITNNSILLKPHSQDYNSTCCINANYNLNAQCPKWLKFTDETFSHYENEKEVAIQLLQEIIGYLLIPGNNLQKGFFFYGVARSGKSLIGNIITNLLGQQNVSNIPLAEIDKDTHIIELASKLLNLAGELEKGVKLKTAKIKSLIGQDKIVGRKLYSEPFYFVNPAKLLTISNHLPYFNDNSDAMLERLVILHFATQVPKEKRNPNLLKELEKEIDGIFMWAIQGLIRLNNRGYFVEPIKNNDIIDNIQDISDTVIYWLVNSNLNEFDSI